MQELEKVKQHHVKFSKSIKVWHTCCFPTGSLDLASCDENRTSSCIAEWCCLVWAAWFFPCISYCNAVYVRSCSDLDKQVGGPQVEKVWLNFYFKKMTM